MAANTCTVSGIIYSGDGSTYNSSPVYINSRNYKNAGDGISDKGVIVVNTDNSGNLSVSLVPGKYSLWTEGNLKNSAIITVPDQASEDIENIIG